MRRAAALFLAVGAAAAGCGPAPSPEPAWSIPVGVYAEFLSDAELEDVLVRLAERAASVTVAVPPPRIGDESLAGLLRAAAEAEVAVRLWLVLDEEQGYWLNESNLDEFVGEVDRLLAWLDEGGLVAEAVVYDMEPALQYSEEIRALDPRDLDAAAALLSGHLDPSAFEGSRERLIESVTAVQSQGLRAVCVTYPQVVDDVQDGDEDLQDALDIPVHGIPFDEVALMVYQTTYAEAVGEWIGPDLVQSYARDAVAELGDRAVMALGKVGEVGMFETDEHLYETPAHLAADIVTAEAEGIGRVEVYSLDGMMLLGGPEPWLTGEPPDERPPDGSVLTDITRGVVAALDRDLDDLRP